MYDSPVIDGDADANNAHAAVPPPGQDARSSSP
jgi:hypothetical protein